MIQPLSGEIGERQDQGTELSDLALHSGSTFKPNVSLTTTDNLNDNSTAYLSPFVGRHIGPRPEDITTMLATLGVDTVQELVQQTIPAQIFPDGQPTFGALTEVGAGLTEDEALAHLRLLANQNKVYRSYIGMGYADCVTPPVILRNLLEDPRWYTPYTPYQPEVSQGRLESLLNFQTLIRDLTGMDISNASLLDEATAAAEAMHMAYGIKGAADKAFFVAADCHPQTIAVVQSRALPLNIEVVVGDPHTFAFDRPIFGALVQYPATDGVIHDYSAFVEKVHAAGGLAVVAAELLALPLITPPGEWGADIAVGSAQRFGVPMGYGGPHAGYFATHDAYKRQIPGRLIGVSRDAEGRSAFRLTLQTREQHIRRDKATSNICTAQALLANVAAMYAVYHGPEGLRAIASRIHHQAVTLAEGLESLGYEISSVSFFDTVRVPLGDRSLQTILARADEARINLRVLNENTLTVTLDETTGPTDVQDLLRVFDTQNAGVPHATAGQPASRITNLRTSPYLTHPIFNRYRSELELQRYLNRLANRDLSLSNSMISLGSCTMKLNAAVEMIPITWPEFGKLHPFAPLEQAQGYQQLISKLETMLSDITGFAGVSLQPNAGSQGEYAGLLVIRAYHASRNEGHRNVCLIPHSAHGTNPASAAMAGMKIVVVNTDEAGNIDLADLTAKATLHGANLAALMITYPSTHGVFEESIVSICEIIHQQGGQVYMDGANMNAMVGLCRPGDFGPDVCHLNLHKTFCIPHGGGGPGVGPIGVGPHLVPFLPSHPVIATRIVPTDGTDNGETRTQAIGPISAAPWGSPSILPISYAYILLMGAAGLRQATEVAILNANYVARRLNEHFPILYRGKSGLVAHECILDLRPLQASAGITVEDIAKRMMDFGFHPPTMSWPVSGTFMIEPTESESKEELDRFCDTLIAIRQEIREIEEGNADRENNPLKHAPHTAEAVSRTEWSHPYTREQAAYPLSWVRDGKYWPPVARIDNVYGDRNIVCSCPSIDEYK